MLRVLDLCSGTGSVEKTLRFFLGSDAVEVVSVDNVASFNPTYCVDIRDWDYKSALEGQRFDIVWASPPCTEYSMAMCRRPRNFELADAIVKRCLEIIEYVKPRWWFVENPGTGHLHRRAFMAPYDRYRNDVCYCHYGRPFKKHTHIWTNRDGLGLPMCNATTPCEHKRQSGTHPMTSQRGPRSSHPDGGVHREYAYSVPDRLLWRLLLDSS